MMSLKSVEILSFLLLIGGIYYLWRHDVNFFGKYEDSFVNKLPKIYDVNEDFYSCNLPTGKFEGKTPKFCLLDVKIEESVKSNSKIIEKLTKYSNSRLHFDHKILQRGICVNKCIKLHEKLGSETGKYEKVEKEELPLDDLEKTSKILFNKLNNVCVNKVLRDDFGILAKTSIKYCVDGMSISGRNYDFFDFGFIIFVSIFLISNILSSIIIRFNNTLRCLNFSEKMKNYFVSFNFKNNFSMLMKTSREDHNEIVNKLNFFKLIAYIGFVFVQVYRHLAVIPSTNSKFFEKTFYSTFYQLSDIDAIVGLILVIFGMELVIQTRKIFEKEQSFWKSNALIVMKKHDELLFLYLIAVTFSSTLISSISFSPFFRILVEKEMDNCNRNWKMNIFPFNNYVKRDEVCLESNWIMTSELHSSFIGFIILFLIMKYPETKNFLSIFAIFIPTIIFISFILKNISNPFSLTTPESLRQMIPSLNRESHMNLGNFMLGLIIGRNIDSECLKKVIKKSSIFLTTIIYFSILITIKIFYYMNDIEVNLMTAMIGSYLKIHHGIFYAFLILKYVYSDVKLDIPLLHVFDKIFRSVIISSLFAVKFFVGATNILQEVNMIPLIMISLTCIVVGLILGFLLHLTYLVPILNLKNGTRSQDELKKVSETNETKKAQ